MRLVLVRLSDDGHQTLGRLYLFDDYDAPFNCATLEPAWEANQKNVSCIPWGRYTVRKRTSSKFGEHLYVTDVRGREYILIHAGNYRRDTSGCILVGSDFYDINNDSQLDVIDSRRTLRLLLDHMEYFDVLTLDVVGVVAP